MTALIDTGFSGALMMSAILVRSLGLKPSAKRKTVLGDGTIRELDMYGAEVKWGARWRPAMVHGAGRDPLVGIRLLEGHRLKVDFVQRGVVEIALIP